MAEVLIPNTGDNTDDTFVCWGHNKKTERCEFLYADWNAGSSTYDFKYTSCRDTDTSTWLSPENPSINNGAGTIGYGAMLFDSSGNTWVFYNKTSGGLSGIYYKTRSTSGVWSAETKVNTTNNAYFFMIAIRSDGVIMCLYAVSSTWYYRVYNGSWGTETAWVSEVPQSLVACGTEFLIFTTNTSGSPYKIYYKKYTSSWDAGWTFLTDMALYKSFDVSVNEYENSAYLIQGWGYGSSTAYLMKYINSAWSATVQSIPVTWNSDNAGFLVATKSGYQYLWNLIYQNVTANTKIHYSDSYASADSDGSAITYFNRDGYMGVQQNNPYRGYAYIWKRNTFGGGANGVYYVTSPDLVWKPRTGMIGNIF